LGAVVEGLAARHGDRISHRGDARGGGGYRAFLSYGTERNMTKYPEEFGQGAIEGVAGPEAANNAAAAGTLVPLLTLGLPTTATAAIMLAGFQQFGLQPGPLLFATAPNWSGG
jgi:putative tricarboxylic transport membrane protein